MNRNFAIYEIDSHGNPSNMSGPVFRNEDDALQSPAWRRQVDGSARRHYAVTHTEYTGAVIVTFEGDMPGSAAKVVIHTTDGTTPNGKLYPVWVGSTKIEAPADVVRAAGFEPMTDDENLTTRPIMSGDAVDLVAQALSEGHRGERALYRAIALRNERNAEARAENTARDVAAAERTRAALDRQTARIEQK